MKDRTTLPSPETAQEAAQTAFKRSLFESLFRPLFDLFEDRPVNQIAGMFAAGPNRGTFMRWFEYDKHRADFDRYRLKDDGLCMGLEAFLYMGCCFGVAYPGRWLTWTFEAYRRAYQAADPQDAQRRGAPPTNRQVLALHRYYRSLPRALSNPSSKPPWKAMADEVNVFAAAIADGMADAEEDPGDLDAESWFQPEDVQETVKRYFSVTWPIVEKACIYEWLRVDD